MFDVKIKLISLIIVISVFFTGCSKNAPSEHTANTETSTVQETETLSTDGSSKSGNTKPTDSQKENNSSLISSTNMQNEDVYWENISSSSSISDFQDYLNNFSENGKYATQAMTKMQEIEWDKAKSENSIKVYKHFLKLHPNSPYRNDCCSSISAIYAEYANCIKEDAEVMSSVQIAPVSGLMTYNDEGSINYPQGTMLTYAVTGDISATFSPLCQNK